MPQSRRSQQPGGLLLARLIEDFLFEVEQTLAEGTFRAYRGPLTLYLRYLRATLGREPRLDDLSIETTRSWVASLKEQPKRLQGGRAEGETPVALESLRTYLRTLRVFANWLARPPQSYCAQSPLHHFKMPKGEDVGKIPITPETFQRLLAAADQDTVCSARSRALLYVLFDCGLRAREIIQLTLGDVSLRESTLLVRRAKGKKPRIVGTGKQTNLALRRYAVVRDSLSNADTSERAPFFQTIHGAPFSYYGLRSWLRRLEKSADVPHVYLHLLRHTSAIETLEAGADVRTVQLKLGHANIATTQRYLNLAARDIGERQRVFSPADHLAGLTTPGSPATSAKGRGHGHKGAQNGATKSAQGRKPLWRRAPADPTDE